MYKKIILNIVPLMFMFSIIAYNNPDIILKMQLKVDRIHQMNSLQFKRQMCTNNNSSQYIRNNCK